MKMNRLHWLLPLFTILLSLAASGSLSAEPQPDEFEIMMQKIRQDFASNPSIDDALALFNEAEGSFSDVDYASIQRTHWPPLVHIDRISDFVFAYTNPQNSHYGEEALYEKIVKGLEFWHERNPWCHNWWYNQIAEPQELGLLLIQMRAGAKQLPDGLEEKILERIIQDGGDPADWTGANRTDIALHWIYRTLLQRDEEGLTYALNNVYEPVVYTTKEGFQHDGSYFQHGQQLYIGGYGDEILKGVTQVAMYTHGTRHAIPQEKLEIVSRFMRETYYPAIRGHYMLFDVMGRSVSRLDVPDKSHTALFARRMMTLDPDHADEFEAIVARLEGIQPANYALTPKHTHYFRGDYTLHIRPNYTFDVRLVSDRTSRCENGNGENLKTYFMSDGCTNIVMAGDEYDGIFPAWNWARIPGVTAPQLDSVPMAPSSWICPGTSTFAGGVSDSLYGVTAYAYTDEYHSINTGAHKAWFFFDDEVVCLGSAINSSASEAVYTAVNQCLASPDAAIVSTGGQTIDVSDGSAEYAADWVLHGGVGYLFPQGGQIGVCCQTQSGSWYDINNSIDRKEPIEKDVFTLYIDHGQQPQDASYAYIVLPDKHTADEMARYMKSAPIEILSNTADIQVVRHKNLGILQMVFYQPGSFSHGKLSVTVDRPCTMILKDAETEHPVLHVSDPGQTGQPIQIGIVVSGRKGSTHSVTSLPSDDPVYAGATRTHIL